MGEAETEGATACNGSAAGAALVETGDTAGGEMVMLMGANFL